MPTYHNKPPLEKGTPLARAEAAMILIHGRGGGPSSITPLLSHLAFDHYAFFIPQADDLTWYPERFLVPRAQNEPYLSSALTVFEGLVERIAAAGIPAERTLLLGFSQGACLALELAARHPRRYGGVFGLSGALIGAEDELTGYAGDLSGVPVFLGCSDVDSHIPVDRVHSTAATFRALGADVTERIYPNMGHTINADEIAFVKSVMVKTIET